jgi:hypothetical protein
MGVKILENFFLIIGGGIGRFEDTLGQKGGNLGYFKTVLGKFCYVLT